MREALHWSCQLLDDRLVSVFSRLAVFGGGWTVGKKSRSWRYLMVSIFDGDERPYRRARCVHSVISVVVRL